MMNCNRYLLLVAVAVLEVFLPVGHHSCIANKNDCNSSCGDISIRLPFRLRSDPEDCGFKSFELDCEENYKTVLYLAPAKYYVREINYVDFSIRLVDPGVQKDNCSSLPRYLLTRDLFDSSTVFSVYLVQTFIFVKCVNPVAQDVRHQNALSDYPLQYVDRSSCYYSSSHTLKGEYYYVVISDYDVRVSYLEDSCHVEMTMLNTGSDMMLSHRNNMTYKDIHDSLLFGFELSFYYFC